MKNQLTLFLILFLFSVSSFAQQPTRWRGENSEAKYPVPDLLAEWPAEGSEILWHYDELGDGFSSPAFANGKIYCTGMEDETGYLNIFDENGTFEKKIKYGKEFDVNYPGTRPTPTIVGDLAYISTGYGELVCLNLTSGTVKWSKKIDDDFGSENLRFGFTESVIIDGDKVYFTPGGKEFNFVALNRMTGDLIWKSAGKGKLSAYCSPKLVQLPERKILVNHTADFIVAVDAKDGKLLWSYPHPNQYNIHPNTPIYQDGALFCFSGYGQGCVKLDLSEDGTSVTKAWSTEKMDNQMGGAMIVDGHVYGSGHKSRGWYCLDYQTGEEKWNSTEIGNGVIIMAADKFILYSDRGQLALVNPSTEKLDLISETKVELGSAQHWAHPVVHNGILYVRHGKSLIAYKI
ncbi:outer membrane protein assembly factor BamB family protein [Sunxiuqinia indica]|uniref:outer membrane protein assembly factor BamB family protein n=1 Tax=Sunxiuqinia indica TaxID=2692584 RepID=UPI00135C8FC0|nr:PQQ-binding-like beta-propeller repeat protein [Sunxiuqinia indica]